MHKIIRLILAYAFLMDRNLFYLLNYHIHNTIEVGIIDKVFNLMIDETFLISSKMSIVINSIFSSYVAIDNRIAIQHIVK